jgi:hypothetical protein
VRIEDYNSEFLQRELYFASRHRVVTINSDVLFTQEDIALIPFDDVGPIYLRRREQRYNSVKRFVRGSRGAAGLRAGGHGGV